VSENSITPMQFPAQRTMMIVRLPDWHSLVLPRADQRNPPNRRRERIVRRRQDLPSVAHLVDGIAADLHMGEGMPHRLDPPTLLTPILG
jgi:hypothetical protein